MNTTQPEALRVSGLLRVTGHKAVSANMISDAILVIESQHARITELESQLAQRFDAADVATAAAQGFRDGVASVSAGSEPEAWREHVEQRLLAWRQSFVNRSGDQLALDDFMDEQSLDDLIDFVCDEWALNTRPSPQEGMAGWQPIETAPKNGTEILGYTEEVGALVLYWDSMTGERDHWSDGMSFSFWKPTHWMPLPAAPGPADGESNGN